MTRYLDENPFHLELAGPFLALRPRAKLLGVINGGHHLRHAAKESRAVHTEEQVNRKLGVALCRTKRLVQPLIAVLRAGPDAVLDGLVYVICGV